MTPKEAAMAVDWLGVERAIPMHWVPGSSYPLDFQAAVNERVPAVRVDVLQSGERIVL
jgi:L-ascorbate metabolism protein UlaG (beta-lactamase superfamily)